MKKLLICTLLLLGTVSAFAQEEKAKEVKTGWSLGVLPTATYSVDNGFQAGAFGDVYNYGDGTTYPDPLHKFSWEVSYFTKSHRMRFYLAYDSKYLIPNMRVNVSATYVRDPLYSFWGFNGPASLDGMANPYDLWTNKDPKSQYFAVNYYGMSRNMLRILANFQGRLADNLNWAAGVNFWNWKLGDMKDTGFKTDKSSDQKYYYDKEHLPENQHFVKINNKETLAQIFTDIRYTRKDNEAMSKTLIDTLIRQGFLPHTILRSEIY